MNAGNPPGPNLVTAADFEACAFEAPIASLDLVDGISLFSAYGEAAAGASNPCDRVYSLLSALCGIHLDPENRGTVWGPNYTSGGKRSMIPSEIKGPQSGVLEGLLDHVQHPKLRARLADVVWSNDLRRGAAARWARRQI